MVKIFAIPFGQNVTWVTFLRSSKIDSSQILPVLTLIQPFRFLTSCADSLEVFLSLLDRYRYLINWPHTCFILHTSCSFRSMSHTQCLFLQTIERRFSEPFDYIRTSRMAGYGMIILGPSLHFWFNFVSKVFPGRDLLSTLKKMVMGQALYGPLMTVVFFSLNARLQGMFNFLRVV